MSGAGRPMRIGIDLGGTKIEGIALDEHGHELARERVSTPQADYTGCLAAIRRLVEGFERRFDARGSVGVGIPGAISPATGRVKNANSTWLIGKPLHEDLCDTLARPVRIANDANCFAVSEATDGAGEGAEVVFGVIVGTGTGAGIAVRGAVLTGPNAIAGEWGHNPLPAPTGPQRPGPPCYCGRTGCIETYLSGPGLVRDHRAHGGPEADARAIASAAERADPTAEATLARYEERMARALAGVINILDPDVIVLGGGVSNIQRLYGNVPKLWGEHVFSDRVDTQLRPPVHRDSSGVRGAAWLWPGGPA